MERIILRLETLKEFNAAFSDLKPVLHNLQSVTKGLSAFMPQMAVEMERVNETIFEVMTMSKIDSAKMEVHTDVKTEGGQEVLEEVAEFLEEQITDKLPAPPTSPVIATPQPQPQQQRVEQRQLVALTASGSEDSEPEFFPGFATFKEIETETITWSATKDDLEESVLEYAKRKAGNLDIGECANDLNVAYGEIEKALETLGVKGKIKIAS
ncbi:MAG: hypothetical protein QCH99_04110 [Candidatus Bathyarchaeota archaeon]|nr:hypothetical protein [Candidatus Bathyarchaeum tardum]WGM88446.1 MAG: hypothetical protein NUK63_05845 [Candidatus Bathyarchaeum tardum]